MPIIMRGASVRNAMQGQGSGDSGSSLAAIYLPGFGKDQSLLVYGGQWVIRVY